MHPLDRGRGGAGLRGLVALQRLARGRQPVAWETVSDWLAGQIEDRRARALAHAVARLTTYADAPDVQAADVLAEQLRAQPVRYLDGGWQHLVDALRRAAETAGVRIAIDAPVHRVTHDGLNVTGVVTADGASHPAQCVVLAPGEPDAAAALVDGEARERLVAATHEAAPMALACLNVVLERRPRPTARLVLGVDEPLYLSLQSDWSRLNAAGAVLHAACFLPPGAKGNPAVHSRLEALADAAVPGWRAHLAHARFLPALTVTHDLVTATSGGLSGRPSVEATGLGGLYITGDWVGPRGYLAQASLASAADAAERARRRLHARRRGTMAA